MLRYIIADKVHEIWARWMRYLFEWSIKNSDGSVTIPAVLVSRWFRQMNTDFANLTPAETNSDYEIADEYIELFNRYEKT